ncbi:MAG: hypothetical protein AAF748_06565 [Pseudomonadota bacterium]
MSAAQAKLVERLIIGLCVLSIIFIFQPYSLSLFSIGCVTVVIGALAFNLVPLCREGVPFAALRKAVLIVLIVLAVAAALGVGTAFLFVEYLETLR